MKTYSRFIRRSGHAGLSVGAILVFVGYLFWGLRSHISVPFWDVPDGSDAILQAVSTKTLIETGTIFHNPRLGAPFGTHFLDFPGADGTLVLLLKILTFFSQDATTVVNIFYMGSFVAVYAAALWVFRKFRIDLPWAIAGALIYTALPYHFLRGVNHLYLATYFVVPLWIWLAVRVYRNALQPDSESLFQPIGWFALIIIVCGTSGVYYSFFGMLIVSCAAVLGSIEGRRWSGVRNGLVVCVLSGSATILNLLPSLVYWLKEGGNRMVGARAAIESDLYGLRISQLILPIWGHSNQYLAHFGRRYHDALKPVTEATSSALGFIGVIGFLVLLLVVFLGSAITRDRTMLMLSKLNLALVLYATVGGFSVLFAMTFTAQFRGVTRISIFIAFIALLGFLLWMKEHGTRGVRHFLVRGRGRYVAALAIALFAFYDQIPAGARPGAPPPKLPSSPDRNSDFHAFIQGVESKVTRGAMVYVMPYVPFPEAPPAFEEGYNGLLRPYFYSTHVRWSYGAMKGRAGDAWLRQIESLPLHARVTALRQSGFEGIYLARKAFRDHGASVEAQLGPLAAGVSMESSDKDHVFYPITPSPTPRIAPEFLSSPGKGFYTLERDASQAWMWASREGHLLLHNFSGEKIRIRFDAAALAIDERQLEIRLGKQSLTNLTLNAHTPIPIALEFDVPPGVTQLKFITDRPPLKIQSDPRRLALRLFDPRVSQK